MGKTLLLLMQSRTIDTYVNVLAHCVYEENIERVIFVGNEVSPEQSGQLFDLIYKVYTRIDALAQQNVVYEPIKKYLPPDDKISEYTLRMDFLHPHLSIKQLRKKYSNSRDLIFDITAASKHLSTDLLTSLMVENFNHIFHFVLNDLVYMKEWKGSKLYHDLLGEKKLKWYTYSDLSKSESTSYSFKKLKAQGNIVRGLMIFSVFSVLSVVVLLYLQMTSQAQAAALISLGTVFIGFLGTVLNFSKEISELILKRQE